MQNNKNILYLYHKIKIILQNNKEYA
jgi:hypothetical protein